MQNTKTALFAVLLVMILAVFGILYTQTRPEPITGEKEITILVTHADKSTAYFQYHTTSEYLGEDLLKEGLISGETGQYGLFITTVDGETADDSKQQWWCITKSGEKLNTSVDTTLIADGEQYELTLMEGY